MLGVIGSWIWYHHISSYFAQASTRCKLMLSLKNAACQYSNHYLNAYISQTCTLHIVPVVWIYLSYLRKSLFIKATMNYNESRILKRTECNSSSIKSITWNHIFNFIKAQYSLNGAKSMELEKREQSWKEIFVTL